MARPRLNLEDLAMLLALLDSGSFGQAGLRLGLAQSTVSQHLKRLEDALGARLIQRGQRGCRPTPAALRILPYAKSLLQLEERVIRASRASAPRLGVCSNIGVYLLPPLLRDFQARGGNPPALVIGSNPEVATQLDHAEVDVALLEWWDERDGFRWQPWRTEPLVVIVAPGHKLSAAKAISRHDLAGMSLIGGEAGSGTGRLLRAYFAGTQMPGISMSLGSTEAVKRAVGAGLGVSLVLACAVAQEVHEGRLCALPLADQPLQKSLRLVWRDDMALDEPLLGYLATAGAA